jgi:hypothetical protein
MSELAVLTPCYSGDAELFADLHQSVLEHTSPRTVHHVVCPPSDKALFERYGGPRCKVLVHSDLVPSRYFCVPRSHGLAVNLRRPWPPVRGWVMQQAMKIAASALIDAGTVLISDSDAVLVRPTTAARFRYGGELGLVRAEDAVHTGMDRHIRWHHVAHRLLGLPAPHRLPLPDYVNPINVWDPAIVRAMQHRISEVTGMSWLDAFTSELHISEFVLYGVFVDKIIGGATRCDPALCHNYYDRAPLDHDQAIAFADRIAPEAVGMMISSHSCTSREVRLAAFRRGREAVSND